MRPSVWLETLTLQYDADYGEEKGGSPAGPVRIGPNTILGGSFYKKALALSLYFVRLW